MFVFPHDSYIEIWIPHVTVLGGRWLGPEGFAIMNRISAPMKEAPESCFAPDTMWGHSEKPVVCNLGEGSHQTPTMLAPWSWTSSLQNCKKYISLIYQPPRLQYFVTAAQMDLDSRSHRRLRLPTNLLTYMVNGDNKKLMLMCYLCAISSTIARKEFLVIC